jgi:hypothetical protein
LYRGSTRAFKKNKFQFLFFQTNMEGLKQAR